MAVQFQKVPIRLTMGLNTKADDKALAPGQATRIENYEQQKTGVLTKRNGFETISGDLVGEDKTLKEGLSIYGDSDGGAMVFGIVGGKDGSMRAGDGAQCLSYVPGLRKLSRAYGTVFARLGVSRISDFYNDIEISLSGGDEKSVFFAGYDSAAPANLIICADRATGATTKIYSGTAALNARPRRATTSSTHFLVATRNNASSNLYVDGVKLSDHSASKGSTTLATNVHTDALIDIFYSAKYGVITAHKNTTGYLEINKIPEDGDVSSPVTVTGSTTISAALTLGEIVTVSGEKRIAAVYQPSASTDRLNMAIIDEDFSGLTEVILETYTPAGAPRHLAFAPCLELADEDSTNRGAFAIFYSIPLTADSWVTRTEINNFDGSSLGGTTAGPIYYGRLASKAFSHNGKAFAWIGVESTEGYESMILASCLRIDDTNENVFPVTRALLGRAKTEPESGEHVPEVTEYAPGKFSFPTRRVDRVLSDGAEDITAVNLNVDFNQYRPYSAKLGGVNFVGGGLLHYYDGLEMAEVGFLTKPYNLEDFSTATTGGSMSNGVYQYVAVFKFTAANGEIVYSAVSNVHTVTLADGGSSTTQLVSMRCNGPAASMKGKSSAWGRSSTPDSAKVRTVLYRTVAGGSTFYRVLESSAPGAVFTANEFDIGDDTLADADIVDNEILYTAGGVLETDSPDACYLIAASSQNLFAVSDEERNKIFVSLPLTDGDQPRFNIANYFRAYPGGEITAIAHMDGNLIIFGDSKILAMPTGTVPNNLGQGEFSAVREIATSQGSLPGAPTVVGSSGVFFISKRGIFLLTRSFETTYIGSAVEAYVSGKSVLSAELVGAKEQVKFLLSDGSICTYQQDSNTWAVSSGDTAGARDATVIGGNYSLIKANGDICIQSDSLFSDKAKGLWESGWIALDGIAGYQSVREIVLTGDKRSDHTMTMRLAYDYKDEWVQSVDFDASSVPDGRYQFRVSPRVKKCTAIKIQLSESNLSGTFEGSALNELTLEVGVLSGTAKLGNKRSF